jgi:hypothetical protein
MNHDAIDAGINQIVKIDVPRRGNREKLAKPVAKAQQGSCDLSTMFLSRKRTQGDAIPVSAFAGRADGTRRRGPLPLKTAPSPSTCSEWIPDNCIQCGFLLLCLPARGHTARWRSTKNSRRGTRRTKLLDMTGCRGNKFHERVNP